MQVLIYIFIGFMENFMLKIKSEIAASNSKYPVVPCFRIKLSEMREDGALYSCVDEKILDILDASKCFKSEIKYSGNVVEYYIDFSIVSDNGTIKGTIDGFEGITDIISTPLTEEFLSEIHSAFEKFYSKKYSLITEKIDNITYLSFTEIIDAERN